MEIKKLLTAMKIMLQCNNHNKKNSNVLNIAFVLISGWHMTWTFLDICSWGSPLRTLPCCKFNSKNDCRLIECLPRLEHSSGTHSVILLYIMNSAITFDMHYCISPQYMAVFPSQPLLLWSNIAQILSRWIPFSPYLYTVIYRKCSNCCWTVDLNDIWLIVKTAIVNSCLCQSATM